MEVYEEPPFQESPTKLPDMARSMATEPSPSEKADDPADNKQSPDDIEATTEETTKVLSELASDIVNNPEQISTIRAKVLNMSFGMSGQGELKNEKDKYVVRSHQAMFHLALSEIRLQNIERDLEKLREDIHGRPVSKQDSKIKKFPHFLHELRRSAPNEFRVTVETAAAPTSKLPALEVLIAGNESIMELDRQNNDIGSGPHINPPVREVYFTKPSLDTIPSPERLRIRSRALIHWLGIVTDNESLRNFVEAPYSQVEGSSALVILRPFKILVTFERKIRQALEDFKNRCKSMESSQGPDETQEDKYLLEEISLLDEFLEVDLKSTLDLRRSISEGTATRISYQDLWHLFQVGGMVVGQQDPNRIYRVIKFTGGRDPLIPLIPSYPEKPPNPVDGFVVDCFELHYDGEYFWPQLKSFTINKYDGFEPINSLRVYPVQFHDNHPAWKTTIMKRSETFLSLIKMPYTHQMYSGKTLDDPPEMIDSQVIVDVGLAINKNPQWKVEPSSWEDNLIKPDLRETTLPPICKHDSQTEGCHGGDIAHKDIDWEEQQDRKHLNSQYSWSKPRELNSLALEDKYLIPNYVFGFVLRSRKWVTLNVNNLSPVNYESTFGDLVLPPGHQDTVRALVRNHSKNPNLGAEATSKVGAAMDLVRGKGKGLIILLHGEPGVGKTSTAECVADLTQRPLFPITCGDIGETALEVQKNLDSNFQMAHKWGSVLLLDEADVFLAKRDKKDLRRNAVVSVFLRTLEYYSGILFLTTNRVGSFDQAFKSRIHMSLFYPKLNLTATLSLYKLLLDRTAREQGDSQLKEFKIKHNEILGFAKKHYEHLEDEGLGTWNGRQIRNAFQTAIALVEYEARQPEAKKPALSKRHFKTVAKASEEFDRYLHTTLRGADADIALREGVRWDEYGRPQDIPKKISTRAKEKKKYGNLDDSESSEESELEESESSKDEDESYEAQGTSEGKDVAVPDASTETLSKDKSQDDENAEFAEFMKWKAMRKKAKK